MTNRFSILLVEDNPGDADLASERLSEGSAHSFDIRFATHLAQGIELLSDMAADAIILDLNLPDSQGVETLRRIKQVAGDAPVIVVSGSVHEALREEAFGAGAEEVLTKEESKSPLFFSVLYAIERSRTRLQHRRLEKLLEAIPDAIVVASPEGAVRYVNPAALHLLGSSFSDLSQQSLSFPLHTGEPAEVTIAHARGRSVCEVRVVEMEWDRKPALLAAIRDITERKRSEEIRVHSAELQLENRRIQEANRLKSEFLANMSHELRTPLNAIIGFSQMLSDGVVDPSAPQHKEFLGYILSSGRHLLQLINDVLDLAKVEAGKIDFHPEPVDLSRLIGDVVAVLRAIAVQKRVRIELDLDVTLSSISLDPARFKQLLYNYLSNAIKFTPEEGSVVVRTRAEPNNKFRIEVADTGVGIAAEDIGKLFQEFQQLEAGMNKQHQGTGLGLALTRRIVEAQGGSVGVDSAPGAGSVFYAILDRDCMFTAAASVVIH